MKTYAMDSNIARATSEIAPLRKSSSETSVQFTDVLRITVARRGNGSPEQWKNGIFIDGLPTSIQSAVCMFWGREQDAHLLEIAQYADKLLEQRLQAPEPTRGASFRTQNEGGRRSNLVAKVWIQSSRTQQEFHRSSLIC